MDTALFSTLQQKIRDNGPLNVQGWKKLLAEDPLTAISSYVAKHKKTQPNVFIRAKL